jgi:hypothetical protein
VGFKEVVPPPRLKLSKADARAAADVQGLPVARPEYDLVSISLQLVPGGLV